MTVFDISGFRRAVNSSLNAPRPSTRYVSHPGAANYTAAAIPKGVRPRASNTRMLRANTTARAVTSTAAAPAAKTAAKKRMFSGRGKLIAGAIAGATVFGSMRNRSGRAIDQQRGRPTGPYMF